MSAGGFVGQWISSGDSTTSGAPKLLSAGLSSFVRLSAWSRGSTCDPRRWKPTSWFWPWLSACSPTASGRCQGNPARQSGKGFLIGRGADKFANAAVDWRVEAFQQPLGALKAHGTETTGITCGTRCSAGSPSRSGSSGVGRGQYELQWVLQAVW